MESTIENNNTQNTEEKSKVPNSSDIGKMLGELAKNSKNIIKPMTSILESISEMNKMLTIKQVFASLKFKLFRRAVSSYFLNFSRLIADIANGFKEVSNDKELSNIITFLGGAEGTEITSRENNKQRIVKTGRKRGFLEVLKDFFELPAVLANVSIWTKMPLHQLALRMKVKGLFKFLKSVVGMFKNFRNEIADDQKDITDTEEYVAVLVSTISQVSTMMEQVTTSRKNFISRWFISNFMTWLGGVDKKKNPKQYARSFVCAIKNLLKNIKKDNTIKNSKDIITGLSNATKGIMDSIDMVSKTAMKAFVLQAPILLGIRAYKRIMENLFEAVMGISVHLLEKSDQLKTVMGEKGSEITEVLEVLDSVFVTVSGMFSSISAINISKGLKKKIKFIVDSCGDLIPIIEGIGRLTMSSKQQNISDNEITKIMDSLLKVITSFKNILPNITKIDKGLLFHTQLVLKGLRLLVESFEYIFDTLKKFAALPAKIVTMGENVIYSMLFGERGLMTIVRLLAMRRTSRRILKALVVIGMLCTFIAATALMMLGLMMVTPFLLPSLLAMLGIWLLFKGIFMILRSCGQMGVKGLMAVASTLLFMMAVMVLVFSIWVMGTFLMENIAVMLVGLVGVIVLVGLIAGLMMLLSFLSPFIEPAITVIFAIAAVVVMLSLAMLLLAITLEKLAKMEIPENVLVKIIAPVGVMMGYIFDHYDVLNPISLALGMVSVMLILPIVLITMIISVMMLGINAIAEKIPEDMTETFQKIIVPIGNLSKLIDDNISIVTAAKALAKTALIFPIVLAIGGMAMTLSKLANLIVPDEGAEWDSKANKFTKYRVMSADDFQRAGENAKLIITSMVNCITSLDLKTLEKTSWLTLMKVKKALKVAASIGPVIDAIQKLANMTMPAAGATYDPKTGKFNKYVQMSQDEFDRCRTNAVTIIETMVGAVMGLDLKKLEETSWWTIRKVKTALDVAGSIGPVVDAIDKLANMTMPAADAKFNPETGKFDKYVKMDPTTMETCRAMAERIIVTMVDCISGLDLTKIEDMKKRTLEKLGMAMEIVGNLSPLLDNIETLAKGQFQRYDKDGKPVGDPINILESKNAIQETVKALVESVANAFGAKDIVDKLKQLKDSKKLYNTLNDVFEIVGGMNTKLGFVMDKDFDADTFDTNIRTLVNSPLDALTTAAPEYNSRMVGLKLTSLKTFGDIYKKLGEKTPDANAVERVSNAGVKFLETINKTDLTKLKSAVSLFTKLEAITRNVKGNFDKLADTIKEDLIDQLEKIRNVLKEINEKGGINNAKSTSTKPAEVNAPVVTAPKRVENLATITQPTKPTASAKNNPVLPAQPNQNAITEATNRVLEDILDQIEKIEKKMI